MAPRQPAGRRRYETAGQKHFSPGRVPGWKGNELQNSDASSGGGYGQRLAVSSHPAARTG